jgi:hypothetical protein
MYDTFSLVDVPSAESRLVISVLSGKRIKGNRVSLHVADAKNPDNTRPGSGFSKPKSFGGHPDAKFKSNVPADDRGAYLGKFKKNKRKKW